MYMISDRLLLIPWLMKPVASICSCCRLKPRTVNSHYADIKALSINHNCGYSYSAVIRIYKSSIMFYVS